MEETLSTQNKPHTNLSSLTKITTKILYKGYSTLDTKTKADIGQILSRNELENSNQINKLIEDNNKQIYPSAKNHLTTLPNTLHTGTLRTQDNKPDYRNTKTHISTKKKKSSKQTKQTHR